MFLGASLAGRGRTLAETMEIARRAQAAAFAGDDVTAATADLRGAPKQLVQDVAVAQQAGVLARSGDTAGAAQLAAGIHLPEVRGAIQAKINEAALLEANRPFELFGVAVPWWAWIVGAGVAATGVIAGALWLTRRS